MVLDLLIINQYLFDTCVTPPKQKDFVIAKFQQLLMLVRDLKGPELDDIRDALKTASARKK